MSTPQRRNLLVGLERAPVPVPEAELLETAARHGFATVAGSAANGQADDAVTQSLRRRRQLTGRDHQFNVRLRADTLQAIYDQANSRNVPIAQVIEEAMAALERQGAA